MNEEPKDKRPMGRPRKDEAVKSRRMHISVPAWFPEQVKQQAKKEGTTIADVIVKAVRRYLESE